MKQLKFVVMSLFGIVLVSACATATPTNPVNTVEKGCETELTAYCADVTPGEGRVLACLYAHEDKISGQCEFALYDAAIQLERAVAALVYVAGSCDVDLDKFCSGVPASDGHLAACLNSNKDEISATCKQALTDVGL